jgi:hypothetical protein
MEKFKGMEKFQGMELESSQQILNGSILRTSLPLHVSVIRTSSGGNTQYTMQKSLA